MPDFSGQVCGIIRVVYFVVHFDKYVSRDYRFFLAFANPSVIKQSACALRKSVYCFHPFLGLLASLKCPFDQLLDRVFPSRFDLYRKCGSHIFSSIQWKFNGNQNE
jgi:hypothetical protein